MTVDDVRDRALASLPEDERRRFDPFTLAILMAILSGVIQWLVVKCLNRLSPSTVRRPGAIGRWRLRSAISTCCADPAILALGGGRNAAEIDRDFGDLAHTALLGAGAGMSEDEVRGFLGEP
jgi:hypothetical protein